MTPSDELWHRADQIFQRVLDLPASEWEAAVDRECGDDEELFALVVRLVAQAKESLPGLQPGGATPAPDIPEIANYRVLERIGEGGMGEVFLAEQQQPIRRRVAIKLIKEGMDSKQVVARFESERQALAIMDHPAIARVYEGGIASGGRPYFVMEWVPGEAITDFCDKNRLDLRERLNLFLQVCDGVQHAHRKAIIHRDLKPSNILVSGLDGRISPKIIDFGVAKATAQPLTEHTMFTAMGQLVGTPSYMSPEQTYADSDIDTRTDVYSLGVLLYELLVGVRPLDLPKRKELAFDELLRAIREEEPERPSTAVTSQHGKPGTRAEAAQARRLEVSRLQSKLRGDLDWITLRALEKDRQRRYGSPDELAEDIQRHLRGEPVLAGPPTAAYRMGKFVRRHKFPVAASSLLLVLLVAFAVMMTVYAGRLAQERDLRQVEAESARRVSDFLVRLFEISNPLGDAGETVTARQLLDEGADRIRVELADEPAVQARLMQTMGQAYSGLGLFEPAAELLDGSLALVEASPTATNDELAKAFLAAAEVDRQRGEFDQGLERATRAREIRAAQTPRSDVDYGFAVAAIGRLRMEKGDYEEGLEILHEALVVHEYALGRDHEKSVGILSTISIGYWHLRRMEEAEPFAKRALAIEERTKGKDHPDVASALNNLAGIYLRDDKEHAAELFERSLAIREKALDPNHPDIGEACNNLGNLLRRMGDLERARELLERGLSIREAAIGKDHPLLGSTIFNLGLLIDESGKPEEATPYLERALGIFDELGAEHPHRAYPLNQLGNVALKLGDTKAAREYYEEALEIRRATYERGDRLVLEVVNNFAKLEDADGRPEAAAEWRAWIEEAEAAREAAEE